MIPRISLLPSNKMMVVFMACAACPRPASGAEVSQRLHRRAPRERALVNITLRALEAGGLVQSAVKVVRDQHPRRGGRRHGGRQVLKHYYPTTFGRDLLKLTRKHELNFSDAA